jgi:DNA invertase Pin-like site-specific DNA recombinase
MHEHKGQKVYKAAMYLRISKEDGKDAGSESIDNQKHLIKEFIKEKQEIELMIELIDDGYSGLNFNRPAFRIMLDLVKTGKINCIIVKDLSRFGRNFIEVGEYIERIFPILNLRFIAVNDNYDSERMISLSESMLYSFKNLMNEAYSKDISLKTRSHLMIKRKNGDFIGAFSSYGYKKSPVNKNKLVVDTYAAEVIREIFHMKLSGMSQGRIAMRLNALGILSPIEYKKILGYEYSSGFSKCNKVLWSVGAVTRVLKNEIYIGNLVQGKETKYNIKDKKKDKKRESDWIRVKHNHEPIIDEEDFWNVQRLLETDTRVSPGKNELYLLSGLIRCGDCGQNLIRKNITSQNKKYTYYICSTYKRNKSCNSHRIQEEKVIEAISNHLYQFLDIHKFICKEDVNKKIIYTNLIEKIYIYEKERIEIIFRFHDIFSGG